MKHGEAIAVKASGTSIARIMLPVKVQGSYDLVVAFTRDRAEMGLAIILPVGARACTLILDYGQATGLDMIDGRRVEREDRKWHRGKISCGEKHTVLVKVRLQNEFAAIEAFLDGAPLVQWQGKEPSLSANYDWSLPQPHRIGLAASGDLVTFHRVRLHMVSGTASWVESKEP